MPQLERNHILLGITHDVKNREQQHTRSNTYPVKCIYARKINSGLGDAYRIEQALLSLLRPYRIPTPRGRPSEILWVDASDGPTEQEIIDVIKLFPGEEIDLNEEIDDDTAQNRKLVEEVARESERRARFRFSLIGIQPGATLTFRHDGEITCEVLSDRHVGYDGERVLLSQAARLAMESVGRANASGAYQGSQYWNFNGKSLQSIRDEVETGETEPSEINR